MWWNVAYNWPAIMWEDQRKQVKMIKNTDGTQQSSCQKIAFAWLRSSSSWGKLPHLSRQNHSPGWWPWWCCLLDSLTVLSVVSWRKKGKRNSNPNYACPIAQVGFAKCKKDKFKLLDGCGMMQRLKESRQQFVSSCAILVYAKETSQNCIPIWF